MVTGGCEDSSFKIISCLFKFTNAQCIQRVVFFKSYFPFAANIHCRLFFFWSKAIVLEHFCFKGNYFFVYASIVDEFAVNVMSRREAAYLRIEVRKVDKDRISIISNFIHHDSFLSVADDKSLRSALKFANKVKW